jgi:hypothetical protein
MRNTINPTLEQGRLLNGKFRSEPGDLHGMFHIISPGGRNLTILSSGTGEGAEGWEHVSVSSIGIPTWSEMCYVKDLFWRGDEVVMQLHPAESEYVNCHPYCLHLWRPLNAIIPTPPPHFVGPKNVRFSVR